MIGDTAMPEVAPLGSHCPAGNPEGTFSFAGEEDHSRVMRKELHSADTREGELMTKLCSELHIRGGKTRSAAKISNFNLLSLSIYSTIAKP